MKKFLCVVFALLLALSACAESVTLTGSVVSTATATASFTYGGTIDEIAVSAGDAVKTGDTVVTLDTTKVYANEAGTARIFGEIGDDCTQVSDRYGAVVYVEPAVQYTISASTSYAYDTEANRVVHPGEFVYLRSFSTYTHTGTGIVTTVSGTKFTVEVLTGDFDTDESVNVFRSSAYYGNSRIGRGDIAHSDPIAYTSEGIIVSYAVKDGDTVEKGDLLYETVSGSYSKNAVIATEVKAEEAGVIASVSVSKGDTVSSGAAAYTFYPDSALRIEASVYESDLASIAVGQKVVIELPYYADGNTDLTGTIEKISRVGSQDSDSEQAVFTVYIIPDDISGLYYGMNAVVNTVEE